MKISVLGTGMVGLTIAQKLTSMGHEITLGTRNSSATLKRTDPVARIDMNLADWLKKYSAVELTDFDKLPSSDVFINATNGASSLGVLGLVGDQKLAGKILIDVANPLDFSHGMPPTLSVCNDDSLGEQIQRAFPKTKVVKTLNTMNCNLMMDPSMVPGDHNVFVSGNDDEAKDSVRKLLEEIGWKKDNVIDLGDITTARGTEMLLPVWLRLWGALGTAEFNFNVVRK